MKSAYPPQLAADLELAEQPDGARTVWIAGSAAVGRYLLLRETERNVLLLVDGRRTLPQICEAFQSGRVGKLTLPTLVKFLAKLDQYGVLKSDRPAEAASPDSPQSQMHYIRFNLFNPDALFARLIPKLRWIWTTGFFACSAGLMAITFLLALMNWPEVSSYGQATLSEHYIALLVAAWLVGVTHEFAHGAAFSNRCCSVD